MKKLILLSILLISGCVIMTDDRLQEVKNFPTVSENEKVSVTIVFDDNLYPTSQYLSEEGKNKILKKQEELAEMRFKQSNLYKSVSTNNKISDYTVTIKKKRDIHVGAYSRPSCDFGMILTGFTFLIIPSFCEHPVAMSQIIEVQNNNTKEKQAFVYELGVSIGAGIIPLLMSPFYADDLKKLLNGDEIKYDNYALRTYQIIESMKK